MMDGLRDYWTGLSDRERRLLMVAGVLAAALLAWLLVRPLMGFMEAAERDHRAAIEREGRVEAKLALLKRPASKGGADLQGASLEQYLTASASEIGLSLSRHEARGNQAASFAIAGGKAAVVAAWLADLEARGLTFDQLSITPQADGTVGVTADVRQVAAQ